MRNNDIIIIDMKSKLDTVKRFFCTRIPLLSLAGIALCWVIYFVAPRERKSIEDLVGAHWVLMSILVWSCIILGDGILGISPNLINNRPPISGRFIRQFNIVAPYFLRLASSAHAHHKEIQL